MTVTAGHADDLQDVSLVDLRRELGRLVDEAYHQDRVVAIRRHHRRVAVLMSAAHYDSLQQALAEAGIHDAGGDAGSSDAEAA